jgi:hypothetical protein
MMMKAVIRPNAEIEEIARSKKMASGILSVTFLIKHYHQALGCGHVFASGTLPH